jgi:hypothetical protein
VETVFHSLSSNCAATEIINLKSGFESCPQNLHDIFEESKVGTTKDVIFYTYK